MRAEAGVGQRDDDFFLFFIFLIIFSESDSLL